MAWQVATSSRKGRAAKISPEAKHAAAEVLEALYANSAFAAVAHAATAAPSRKPRGTSNGDASTNATGEDRLEFMCSACAARNWCDRTKCRACGEPRGPGQDKPTVANSSRPNPIALALHAATSTLSRTRAHHGAKPEGQSHRVWPRPPLATTTCTTSGAYEHSPSPAPQWKTRCGPHRQHRLHRPHQESGGHPSVCPQIWRARRRRPAHGTDYGAAPGESELAHSEAARSAELLDKAQEGEKNADKDFAELGTLLDDLRPQAEEEKDEQANRADDPDNLMECFDDLLDALRATLAARTPRIFAAVNAVRSILTGATEEDDIAPGSEASEGGGQGEDMAPETASSREAHETADSSSETGRGTPPPWHRRRGNRDRSGP